VLICEKFHVYKYCDAPVATHMRGYLSQGHQRRDDYFAGKFITGLFVKEGLLTAGEGTASGPGYNGPAAGGQMITARASAARVDVNMADAEVLKQLEEECPPGKLTALQIACRTSPRRTASIDRTRRFGHPYDGQFGCDGDKRVDDDVQVRDRAAEDETKTHDGSDSGAETESDGETKTRATVRGRRDHPKTCNAVPTCAAPASASSDDDDQTEGVARNADVHDAPAAHSIVLVPEVLTPHPPSAAARRR
jgi:hypothetical protein